MADFNTWLNSLNVGLASARHIDDDADGSFDCVDVAEDWCKYLWPGVPVNAILGYGNACDLYANSSSQYFDKLPDTASRPGDIPVWGATATNAFGHIAVTINDDGTNLTDVEQNTYTQEAATIAHRTHNNIIGFLRPKGLTMDKTNINTMRIAHSELKGWDFNDVHSGKFDKSFTDAYGDTTPNDFLLSQFTSAEAESFRQTRAAWAANAAQVPVLQQKVADLSKALQSAQSAGFTLDQATKDQIANTNAVVQWLKDKLSSVFK
jgi:hypothetical protein